MNHNSAIIAAVIAMPLYWGCGHTDHAREGHDHAAEITENAGHDSRTDEIILHSDAARRFGVEVEAAVRQPVKEVMRVAGSLTYSPSGIRTLSARSAGELHLSPGITDGTALSAGQRIASVSAKGYAGGDAVESSAVELETARRELARITPLYNEGLASRKDYLAAEAAVQRAKTAYSGNASGSAVTSPVKGVIRRLLVADGQYVEAGTPVAEVVTDGAVALRADVPASSRGRIAGITTANFRTSDSDTIFSISDFNGRRITSADAVATSGAVVPVFFSLDNKDGRLLADTYADVYLVSEGTHEGIMVPAQAVVEQQGSFYVYVRLDAEGYQKRLVRPGHSDGRSVEILSGIQEGDSVVSAGASVIRMAETSSVVPEGHSHNH